VRGVILAAGAGTRLAASTIAGPKCLAPFNGVPLIELQMRALRACGIDEIVVVVGYQPDRVRRVCGPGVRFVENRRFARTNSLYSLWLARPLLTRGFVVLNCDVLFHPALLADLLTAHHENAALVSYPEAGDPPMTAEEMKVSVRRGRVVDMRKDLPPRRTDAENVGIVKFGAAGAKRLVAIMSDIVVARQVRDWAPRAYAAFAREEPLYAIGTRGLPWTEIDTPEDYEHAVLNVFPAIQLATHEIFPDLQLGA
jgi:L-glutamine-phosphate cytidylyltransferase